MATAERKLGDLGTVEEAYKYQGGKPYHKATKPKAMGVTTITGSIPTEARRTKLATIEREQAKPNPKPIRGGGKALWIEYLGYARGTDSYGLKTKIRGMKPVIQWVPYSIAERTWTDIAGTEFAEVVKL